MRMQDGYRSVDLMPRLMYRAVDVDSGLESYAFSSFHFLPGKEIDTDQR